MAADERTRGDLSRRRLLKLGAAAGAAAGAASLGLQLASVSAATTPNTPGVKPTGRRSGPKIHVPRLVSVPANAVSEAISLFDCTAVNGTLQYNSSSQGVYSSGAGGFTLAGLDVPAGATIKAVYGFGTSTQGAGQAWTLYSQDLLTNAVSIPIGGGPTTAGASGWQLTTLSVDFFVAPYARLFVQAIPSGDSNNTVNGIGYDFVPASPSFNTIVPQRVYDSRLASGPIAGGATRTISVATSTTGAAVVPAGASAVFYNLTVVNSPGNGYLALFPFGTAWPHNSSINYSNGLAIANSGLVALGGDRQVNVLCNGARTNFIIDITGYYL